MEKQSRGWCWTLNNYSEEEYENMKNTNTVNTLKILKYVIGREIGKNGTAHLQGYYYFKSPKKFKQIKEINNRAHWEAAKGNPEQNYKYCSKEGDYIEYGYTTEKKKRWSVFDTWNVEIDGYNEESARDWLKRSETIEDEPYEEDGWSTEVNISDED